MCTLPRRDKALQTLDFMRLHAESRFALSSDDALKTSARLGKNEQSSLTQERNGLPKKHGAGEFPFSGSGIGQNVAGISADDELTSTAGPHAGHVQRALDADRAQTDRDKVATLRQRGRAALPRLQQ